MGTIIHQQDVKQLNILDDRFYTMDGENFYPSVTTVLEVMPEGYGLEVWKKDLGHAADEVLRRAGIEGSNVHDAIEAFLLGQEICWVRENGTGYTLSEWTSISRFIEFWQMVQDRCRILALETKVLSVNLRLGGTIDLVIELDGFIWLIDFKTSNYMHDTYWLQTAGYAEIWNELHPQYKIQRRGILHLKGQTRGADKTGKSIQGKGWKLYENESSQQQDWDFFCTLRTVWDHVNPDYKPKNLKMPDRFKLNRPVMPLFAHSQAVQAPDNINTTGSASITSTLPSAPLEVAKQENLQSPPSENEVMDDPFKLPVPTAASKTLKL